MAVQRLGEKSALTSPSHYLTAVTSLRPGHKLMVRPANDKNRKQELGLKVEDTLRSRVGRAEEHEGTIYHR